MQVSDVVTVSECRPLSCNCRPSYKRDGRESYKHEDHDSYEPSYEHTAMSESSKLSVYGIDEHSRGTGRAKARWAASTTRGTRTRGSRTRVRGDGDGNDDAGGEGKDTEVQHMYPTISQYVNIVQYQPKNLCCQYSMYLVTKITRQARGALRKLCT